MSGTRIYSKVFGNEVYVRLGDIVNSINVEIATTDNTDIKTAFEGSVRSWEDYEERILNKSGRY